MKIKAMACLLAIFAVSCTDNKIYISCNADNDLYKTLISNEIRCVRFDDPQSAVDKAPEGSGVMILADRYPSEPTLIDSGIYSEVRRKNLRFYVEYPSMIPGITTQKPRGTQWERAVISSDVFSPALQKLRILAIHDCHFIPADLTNPDIVVARIAGFDSAVYGLPEKVFPILAEIKMQGEGMVLVSTTKLSQFISGRYAPADAWKAIWDHIIDRIEPGTIKENIVWEPSVRPAFSWTDDMGPDSEEQALKQGIEWYFDSGMILSEAGMEKYNKPANSPDPARADPDLKQDWPFGHRVGTAPVRNTGGDGSLGVLEGFDAKIFYDGSQPVRWWRRGDCNGEIAGAMSVAGFYLHDQKYLSTATNIADWLFFKSMISLGDRADPDHPAFGLSGWNDIPEYCGPGLMDGFGVYYGDDNARVVLGMMMAAAALNTDRYDRRLLNIIMGNLRISGIYGFQPDRIDHGPLMKTGWERLYKEKRISYSPHYQSYMWACYLWAYNQTGFELFRERAETAISMTMAAYPDGWNWSNGIQQERARMLLCLSWLIRVDDTPEHREWLKRIASDLLKGQTECGAIREELGAPEKGGMPPPQSNEAYGTSETPLIQHNGNSASDMLYTTNFAYLGFHEAAAATGEQMYRDAEDKLTNFLCRIQARSDTHPEYNGAWFRAFDFNRWEYWASNADAGWGAWSIESGWSQSWITSVLALRGLNTSLWDFTRNSNAEGHFEELRKLMLPLN